ncbi:MAG: RNB domain-containing ribonuclease [Bacteroides sp.]|nr:RNB domain-containing ribonuclease [Prevotella sp.]MCM1408261.1 RNB domain-containing ribonuclease [Treponema brennaborense]MCM1470507.1 RNB domain-containing ribonuclease [Bacteroides sp.]
MIPKNALVIYKNQPAIVLEAGEKYTIRFCTQLPSAGGKPAQYATQKVRNKDIRLLHAGSVSSIETILLNASDKMLAEQLTRAVQEAHELLLSDAQTSAAPISVKELAELALGDFSADTAWALYSLLTETPFFAPDTENAADDGIFFIPRTQEAVSQIRQKADAKEHETEIRNNFLLRLKKKQLDLPADRQFMQEIEALALGKTGKSKIMKDAGFSETPEKAHKLLLDTGIWDITRNPHPPRFDLSTHSAAEVLPPPPEEERFSVSHTAYAIDNEWSTDPDDAVAFDGTYLWVHIADPASTVLPDTSIDLSARERGATLYIPEGAARMLSEESLEDYALGLREFDNGIPTEQKSRALSFKIQLDEFGNIIGTDVLRTLVFVKRITYKQADEQKHTEALAPLFSIAQRNIARREKAGAVFIKMPEIHISVRQDEYEKHVEITDIPHYESADVVRELMLLAGEAAAKFAFSRNIPFPYISQDAPDIPDTLPQGLAGQYKLRRCMRSRTVSVTPSAHAGLGLAMYSQTTSPLRRYGDLAAHQQLRAFITGKEPMDKDTLLEHISAGDAAAGAAVKAERKSNLHWILVYLLRHPQWTGNAVAVEIRNKQTVFFIPQLALETSLVPNGAIALNESITVQAGSINLAELTVTFRQVGTEK